MNIGWFWVKNKETIMLATLVTSFLIVFSYYIESLVLIIDLQFALEFNNMTE